MSIETDNEIARIESHIEGLKKLIEKRDLALRLEQIPEFRKLILEGYCMEECARYTHMSVNPTVSVEERMFALQMAQSSGLLKQFLSAAVRMGNQAVKETREGEAAILELRTEGQG